MKFIYPAVFRQTPSGAYEGFFPDLTGCTVKGDTLDEAMDEAIAAAGEWISIDLSEELDLPPVTDPADIPLQEGDIVRNIGVTIRFMDGWDE